MKKYVVGLALLGLLTLGLAAYVISLGAASKQDEETHRKASTAASELNSYISSSREIPASLQEAGITDIPSTVRYNKLSSERYEFCVTYKTNSSGYATPDITSALYGGSLANMGRSSLYDAEVQPTERAYLYLSYAYRKGESCQTIKPAITRSIRSSSSSNYQDSYDDYCAGDKTDYQAYCSLIESYLD